jgi:hypothetical protein
MKIALLIGNIATLATTISAESKTDVFFHYNAKCKFFNVSIYNNGWHSGADADEDFEIWQDEGETKAIAEFESLKSHLMNIYQGIKQEVA